MMSRNALIIGLSAIVAIASLALGLWFTVTGDRLGQVTRDVNRDFIQLERAIGYGGLIHNFKNHVLRPEEDRYRENARADYQEAVEAISDLKRVLSALEIDVDLETLRLTLDRYADMIDVVDEQRAQGLGIRDIDRLVRILDDDAVENLSVLQDEIQETIDERFNKVSGWRIANFALTAFFVLLFAITLVLHRAQDRRARLEQEAKARLDAVFRATDSGIIGFDSENRITMLNEPARRMIGCGSKPTPFAWPDGIRFLQTEDLKPLDASADPIKRTLAGQTIRTEIHLVSRSEALAESIGGSFYARLSSAHVTGSESGIATVVFLEDVSEQERNRQQVERSSRLDALGQLTGGIAHDFNNLLATIQYALDLAITDDLADEKRGVLETAARSVDRGAKLTNRLLAFAKRQPGLAVPRAVDEILSEFRALAAPTIEERIEFVFPDPRPDLRVFCDSAQLENALLNLVLNSRDAMLRSGTGNRIEIQVHRIDEVDALSLIDVEQAGAFTSAGMEKEQEADRERDDERSHRYIEITVSDNGPGMSEEVKRRALDPFFTTKKTNSGTGLGLSMVYGFVQQSNGELRIYSEPGVGTSVRLRLPAASIDGEREEPAARPSRATGQGQRILVVEDEDGLRRMIEAQIKALGYEVLTAASDDDALKQMEAGAAVELLLTDVVMPGNASGFDLARRLREKRPDLPIIYMSGYTGFSAKDMGDVPGVLLQKPCPPAELARALSEALAGKSEAA